MTAKTTRRGLLGNFYLESQVKHRLHTYYFKDAYQWRLLYNNSLDPEYYSVAFEAKRFVFLSMAYECMLKAILISLSKREETAEQIYKVARDCNHKLERLVLQCKNRAKKHYRICSNETFKRIQQIDKLGIAIRYNMDMMIAYTNQYSVQQITNYGADQELSSTKIFTKP